MSEQLSTLIRPATADDINFILNSWLTSAWHDRNKVTIAEGMGKQLFMSRFHTLFTNILASPDTVTLIACNPETPEQIYSYCVCNPGRQALHWVYTKYIFRSLGFARRLLETAAFSPDQPIYCSLANATTETMKRRNRKLGSTLRYDPTLLFTFAQG